MATRLQNWFVNTQGEVFTIHLDDAFYTDPAVDVLTSGDGFKLRYDGETVIGSKCSVTFVVNDDTDADIQSFADDLLTGPEGRFTLKIIYQASAAGSETMYWIGYVLPDLSGYEDLNTYGFTVVAADGLGRLDGFEYKDTGDVPYGFETILAHILNCLTQGELESTYYNASTDIFLRTVVNWHDDAIGAPTAAVCPLSRMQISGELFAQRKEADGGQYWKFKSCYEVLKLICIDLNARLYYSFGCYRFEQFNERDQDLFYERRFSYNGTLISSSASTGYDKPILQTAASHKLAVVTFEYQAAFERVVVTYDHGTFKNYLEGLSNRWYYGSPTNSAVSIFNISTLANTKLRIKGRIKGKMINPTYTAPWRYKFVALIYTDDGDYLVSETHVVLDGSGNPTNLYKRDPLTWGGSGVLEISTDFVFQDTWEGVIDFEFESPVIPTGIAYMNADFYTFVGEDNLGNAVYATPAPVLGGWAFTDLRLFFVSADNPDSYEAIRIYTINNPASSNSKVLEIAETFGHAVKTWTPTKILTSSDGSTWTDTDDSWAEGSGTTDYEFGELLANELMQARRTSTRILNGSIGGHGIMAHSRITTLDEIGWILLNGEYTASYAQWTGQWLNAGIDRITLTTIKKKVAIPPVVVIGGNGPSNEAQGFGLNKGKIALSAVTTNHISTEIAAGSVSSIPLTYAVAADAYLAGDDVFVVNPETGDMDGFTVSATASAGDTSLSVTPVTITKAYPIGSHLVYSALNKYTGEGGGGQNLPMGTAAGQIMRWNNSTQIWEVYSGVTDGHVLTWDATNGWQSEAGGTVTGSGSAGQVAYWSGASAIAGENNLWWDATNDRLGIGTSSPGKTVHYLGSLYGINGQHQWGRYNQTPATPYSAVEFEGLQADPISVSTPAEDAVAIFRAMTAGGTRASTTLAVGVWSGGSDAYGAWIQARDRAAFNTYRPILAQPRGGKFAVGRVSSGANTAAFTVRYPTSTSSSGAGNYIANFESGETLARIGISTGTDTVKGAFHYDGANVISRLCNLDGGATATIRFSVGGTETADKVVIMPTGNGRLGAGFSSTTGLHSTLQSSGSLAASNLNTLGAPTFDETRFWVTYSGTTNQTWTLPSPSACAGRTYVLANLSASSTITLSQNVKKANGSTFNTLTAGQWAIISPDSSTWYGFKLTSA